MIWKMLTLAYVKGARTAFGATLGHLSFHLVGSTPQGPTKHSLDQFTRQSLLITFTGIAKRPGRPPSPVIITGRAAVIEEVPTLGGFEPSGMGPS
jgi:hypothetical protein